MKLAKILTLISALVFGGIGFACLFFPENVANGLGMALTTPTAIIDFRATYGGFLLSLGFFFVYCLFNKTFLRVGLILQAVSLSGFALGRIVGLVLDGMPKMILIYFLIAEIVGAFLAVYAFLKINNSEISN